MTAFTIGGLALVGIPPLAGFVSKWHIATTALGSGTPYFSIIVPVILLVSALLTAGYLMGPAADAWFVAKAPEHAEAKEAAEVSEAEVAEVSEVAADVVEATEEKKENAEREPAKGISDSEFRKWEKVLLDDMEKKFRIIPRGPVGK